MLIHKATILLKVTTNFFNKGKFQPDFKTILNAYSHIHKAQPAFEKLKANNVEQKFQILKVNHSLAGIEGNKSWKLLTWPSKFACISFHFQICRVYWWLFNTLIKFKAGYLRYMIINNFQSEWIIVPTWKHFLKLPINSWWLSWFLARK